MSANALKLIAIAAMTIDHIAWTFVPTATLTAQLMHTVGRLTLPIMCFFISEGYHRTHNLKRYILRMAVFAVISHFAYSLYSYNKLPLTISDGHIVIQPYQSVMTNLLFALISLSLLKSDKVPKLLSILLTVLMLCLSPFMDWGVYVIPCTLAFGLNYGNRRRQLIWMTAVTTAYILSRSLEFIIELNTAALLLTLFRLGIFLTIPLLLCYNGKLGKGGKPMKVLFYAYYPVHLLLIALAAKIYFIRR